MRRHDGEGTCSIKVSRLRACSCGKIRPSSPAGAVWYIALHPLCRPPLHCGTCTLWAEQRGIAQILCSWFHTFECQLQAGGNPQSLTAKGMGGLQAGAKAPAKAPISAPAKAPAKAPATSKGAAPAPAPAARTGRHLLQVCSILLNSCIAKATLSLPHLCSPFLSLFSLNVFADEITSFEYSPAVLIST